MAKLEDYFFLLICFLVTIPTLYANVKEENTYWLMQKPVLSDAYWKERATVAEKENQAAFTPDPYAVSGNFTSKITE